MARQRKQNIVQRDNNLIGKGFWSKLPKFKFGSSSDTLPVEVNSKLLNSGE
jgi:hypothetical protein